ncbi:MAG: phenylalanine--tRNA ligase subunit beta, partial [Actinobacteria bacterium]|nr:phenylalanine--tRNA ligase subunit beta [Actinomycetota bacterium]
IMRTSSGLGLRSEASNRFEKKLDPHLTIKAIKRFDELLSKITAIKTYFGIYDNYKRQERTRKIYLRPDKIKSILGESIKTETICKILTGLELKAIPFAGDTGPEENQAIEVTVPSIRFEDLEREIDLIEEIARIYGFENLKPSPPQIMLHGGRYSFAQKTLRKIRQNLCNAGFDEVINYSFISNEWISKTKLNSYCSYSNSVCILNPINEEFAYLRTSPMPLMIKNVQNNLNHDVKDIKIFEITKVYAYGQNSRVVSERNVLGVMLSGKAVKKSCHSQERIFDIYDAKAVIEMLAEQFYGNFACIDLQPGDFGFFHPSVSAEIIINSKPTGFMGKIHPFVLDGLDIKQDIFYTEIDLDAFIANIDRKIVFSPIPQFPSIDIDIALVMDREVKHFDIINEIKKSGTALLKSVRLFDIYEGKQIDEGKKSMAYSLTFSDEQRTLKDTEVDIIVKRIIENLSRKFGVFLRK